MAYFIVIVDPQRQFFWLFCSLEGLGKFISCITLEMLAVVAVLLVHLVELCKYNITSLPVVAKSGL
jgi:hypothetical protein